MKGTMGARAGGSESARIFEGSSDTLLHNSSVVVEGNKIFGLGNSARVTSGTEVIDLGDATLSLGFIDAHTNLTWDMTNLTKFFCGWLPTTVVFGFLNGSTTVKMALTAGK
jgi:imidazolonepropionase-like amidohydrolase